MLTARFQLLGLGLGLLVSAGACSLILSPGDLDAQYGRDGGGGSSVSAGHGGHAASGASNASTTSSGCPHGDEADAGPDAADGGCSCTYGCDDAGHCDAGVVEQGPTPQGIACGPEWIYTVGSQPLTQYARSGKVCSCITATDPGAAATAYSVAVGGGQVVWRTVDNNGVYRFWSLPDADCCCGPRAANLVVSQSTPTDNTSDFGNGLATDGASLVWLDANSVKVAPLSAADAGTGTVIFPGQDGGSSFDGLAISSGTAFFDAYNNPYVQAVNLYDGGTRSWLDMGQSRGIQTNGHYAAWAVVHHPGDMQGEIHGVSIDEPSDLAGQIGPLFQQPAGLAIDDQYIYVSDSMAGTISRVAIAAPNATDVLWAGGGAPAKGCADGTFFYWLMPYKDGGLFRVEKSPP